MSALSSRVDAARTGLSARTSPDVGPVLLTSRTVSGDHRRSSGRAKRGRKPHTGAPRRTLAGSQPGRDLLTSQFEAGSRELVLAALKQRSQSAPKRWEVKVQLFEPQQSSSSSHNAAGAHKGAPSLSADLGDDFSASEEVNAAPRLGQGLAGGRGPSRTEALPNRRLELQNPLSARGVVTRHSNPAPPASQQVDPAVGVINLSARTSVETDLVTMATPTDHSRQEHRARVVSVATQANGNPAALTNELAREAGPAQTESAAVLPPMLEEARQLLRQLQRQKKVLDDNLETAARARTGEVLRCQLEALAANSESSEQARITRTVDAWIHLVSKDVQSRMEEELANGRSIPPPRQPSRSVNAHGGAERTRTPAGRGLRSQAARGRPAGDESYLPRLLPTPGLKMASPGNRKPRPHALDGVKGAKMKSSQRLVLHPSPAHRQSSHPTPVEPTGPPVAHAKVPSPPMAIPLAHPRIGPSPRCQQTVTSLPVALAPLEPPAPDPPPEPSPGPLEEPVVELGVAPDEGLEVKLDSPAWQEQAELVDAVEAHPAPPIAVEVAERKSEEDDGAAFPGTEFLAVADAGRESVAEALHSDGAPSPPALVYRGPEDRGDHGSAPSLDDDALNRMVQWLEQQLMARMISERHPPPPPVADRPDAEEPSVTSDMVDTAGRGGLQLFVDAGVQVDSPFVKELVNEVLSEMLEQALAPREAPIPGPNPGPSFQAKTAPAVATPLPTPPPSPVPSIGDALPLYTPPPSEPTSLQIDDSPQPIITAPPEPVSTPIPSPEPNPPAEIPPSAPNAPSSASSPLDEQEDHLDTRSQVLEVQEDGVPRPPRAPSPVAAPEPPSGPDDDTTGGTDSSTVTESDRKMLSEGELLISSNRVDALTEEASSSSFLQDVDLDPPSEGQVKLHTIEMAHTLQPDRSLEEALSSGEVTHSIAPQLDRKINHAGDAILEAANDSVGLDSTLVASQTLTSDLQSEPSQAFPFGLSSPQPGQPEVSISTPEKMTPSSDDSSDFF